MAASIVEKMVAAEEALSACQDAEMPFLKGIEVLPTEESSKAISDCEAAAAQAFAAVNQAKTEIRSKQKVYVREGKKKTAQVVSNWPQGLSFSCLRQFCGEGHLHHWQLWEGSPGVAVSLSASSQQRVWSYEPSQTRKRQSLWLRSSPTWPVEQRFAMICKKMCSIYSSTIFSTFRETVFTQFQMCPFLPAFCGRLHSYILPIPAGADDLHKFTRTANPSVLLPTGSFDECR